MQEPSLLHYCLYCLATEKAPRSSRYGLAVPACSASFYCSCSRMATMKSSRTLLARKYTSVIVERSQMRIVAAVWFERLQREKKYSLGQFCQRLSALSPVACFGFWEGEVAGAIALRRHKERKSRLSLIVRHRFIVSAAYRCRMASATSFHPT